MAGINRSKVIMPGQGVGNYIDAGAGVERDCGALAVDGALVKLHQKRLLFNFADRYDFERDATFRGGK